MLRYAITDGSLRAGKEAPAERLIARSVQLAQAGVEFLLLREKQLGAGELAGLARRVVGETAGSGMRVVVPGRADVALAAGAQGVHLTAHPGELKPSQVRQLFSKAWISVSCHTADEVRQAAEDGADAVLFGPVFDKVVDGSAVVAGVGVERLAEACRAASIPVFALGGVTPENAVECRVAGASGIAGIRMFFAGA